MAVFGNYYLSAGIRHFVHEFQALILELGRLDYSGDGWSVTVSIHSVVLF